MSKVTVQVIGAEPKVVENTSTVAEALRKAGVDSKKYTIMMNGDAAEPADEVTDFAYISLTEKVKGA